MAEPLIRDVFSVSVCAYDPFDLPASPLSGGAMKQSPALSKVARGDLCAGCGGCALVAPDAVTMEMTPPGYLRPRQSGPVRVREAKVSVEEEHQLRAGLDQVGELIAFLDHAPGAPRLTRQREDGFGAFVAGQPQACGQHRQHVNSAERAWCHQSEPE